MNFRYFEITFNDGYSICIRGMRRPTLDEATIFCKSDMEYFGLKNVVEVIEIDKKEAHDFFDMENESVYPIFGEKEEVE